MLAARSSCALYSSIFGHTRQLPKAIRAIKDTGDTTPHQMCFGRVETHDNG